MGRRWDLYVSPIRDVPQFFEFPKKRKIVRKIVSVAKRTDQ